MVYIGILGGGGGRELLFHHVDDGTLLSDCLLSTDLPGTTVGPGGIAT